jgi:tetratricopeptide (TPR) repeat protein
MRKASFILLCVLSGLLAGLLASELILRLFLGSPRRELTASHVSYFEFEIYDPLFRKVKSPEGEERYRTARSGVIETEFPAVKPPGTRRVFILGESVAADFGNRSSLLLANKLHEHFPSCSFEIIPCMTVGYDSYRVLQLMKEVVNYRPDLVLVFAGNNTASHLRPGLPLKLYSGTWIYRLIDRNFLVRSAVQRTEKDVNAAFTGDLEQMSEICRRRKIPLALFTLPCNFKDLPPSGPGWFFSRNLFLAQVAFEKGLWNRSRYFLEEQLKKGNPREQPQILYATGRCLEKAGRYSRAKEYFIKALTLEGNLAWRCPPQRNEIIRKISAKNDLILVDLERKFISLSPHGLVGDDFFKDNCHWLEPYDRVVVESLISSLNGYLKSRSITSFGNYTPLPAGSASDNRKLFLEARETAFSETLLNYYCLLGVSFILQGKETGLSLYFFRKVAETNPELMAATFDSREEIKTRIAENPWVAPLSDSLDGCWPAVLWQAGEALRETGNYSSALRLFDRALDTEAGSKAAEPYLLRGLTYYMAGNDGRALSDWKCVAGLRPGMKWLLEPGGIRASLH